MRDNHKDMVELLDVDKSDNIYSSLIQIKIDDEVLKLRFGIISSDFARLKKILDFRPYENTGVAAYRYFFALSYRNNPKNDELAFISVRVEQIKRHKQHEFNLSKNYISNILWFSQIKDKKEIEKLIEK